MIERIQEIMRSKHLSASQFADEIGIQRSGLSHILSGRNKPSLEFVMKVLKQYPEIKADWLLYGLDSENSDNLQKNQESSIQTEIPLFNDSQEDNSNVVKIKSPRFTKKNDLGDKFAEKIVIFYSDRTFREYSPGE